ncbi:hypothetical protein ABZW18_26125 [Streptomyces sp. NPDC004647]|uniref:hypothetical protein n=1 Tax=Streptomyces sp. NPDC004647 TaxID=3154671 RepID=UPI0033BACDD9
MQQQTTINELVTMQGLFTEAIAHIEVDETEPNTGTTNKVWLPIRDSVITRTTRRDEAVVWIIQPAGVHQRIHVADQAPVTVIYRDVDPGRFTGHLPPPQHPQQQPGWHAPAAPPAQAPPAHTPGPPPAAPHRPAAPWNTPPPHP